MQNATCAVSRTLDGRFSCVKYALEGDAHQYAYKPADDTMIFIRCPIEVYLGAENAVEPRSHKYLEAQWL